MKKPRLVLVIVQAHRQNHQEPELTIVLLANPADKQQIWMLRKPIYIKHCIDLFFAKCNIILIAERKRQLHKRNIKKPHYRTDPF